MKIIILDTETTGGGPSDRICQLSVKRSAVLATSNSIKG